MLLAPSVVGPEPCLDDVTACCKTVCHTTSLDNQQQLLQQQQHRLLDYAGAGKLWCGPVGSAISNTQEPIFAGAQACCTAVQLLKVPVYQQSPFLGFA